MARFNELYLLPPPPGPYSLNGYRVRVYRQDSATQWFTGIITHHDLFSRNMVVMNDQVPEHTVYVMQVDVLNACLNYTVKLYKLVVHLSEHAEEMLQKCNVVFFRLGPFIVK